MNYIETVTAEIQRTNGPLANEVVNWDGNLVAWNLANARLFHTRLHDGRTRKEGQRQMFKLCLTAAKKYRAIRNKETLNV